MIKKFLSKKYIFLIFVTFGLFCSVNVGITYDEFFHIGNGERRLRYLFSLGYYDYYSILHLKYYPGFYDTISSLITSSFPKSIYNESYHIVNFCFGLSGIIALKKFIKITFNKKTSEIFFILSFFTPVFFGHLGFNPKDTIIAAANFWVLYYSIKYLKSKSNLDRSFIATKIGIFIGLGAGVRIVFLATLTPIIIFFLLEYFFIKKISKLKNFKNLFFDLTKAFLISYFIIILCWPEVHKNIITEPSKIFIESLTDISQGVQTSYFAGSFYKTANTPWYYLIINFFYKTPVFHLLLFFISFVFFFKIKKEFSNKSLFNYFYIFSLSMLFIPIFIAILLNVKIHDGLRYFLFIVPIFNILPSIFLFYLFSNRNFLYNKILIFILSPFLIYFLLSFIMISPYQYSYLNLFSKFLLKDNSFENDYWGSSIKELVKNFVKTNGLIYNPKIATCGLNSDILEYYMQKYGIKTYIMTDMHKEFDYAILINRAISEHDNNGVKNQTCFQKFKNKENLYVLSRNSIILSKVVKY